MFPCFQKYLNTIKVGCIVVPYKYLQPRFLKWHPISLNSYVWREIAKGRSLFLRERAPRKSFLRERAQTSYLGIVVLSHISPSKCRSYCSSSLAIHAISNFPLSGNNPSHGLLLLFIMRRTKHKCKYSKNG